MSVYVVLLTAAGAGLGALLGKLKSCPDGGCPLTANPKRGAVWGGLLGLLIALSAGQGRAKLEGPGAEESAWLEIATTEDFKREVLDQPGVTVAYFYGEWCHACQYYKPTLEKFAQDAADRARYVQVDVGTAPAVAKEYGVDMTPTLLFLSNGEVQARLTGRAPEEALLGAIEKATLKGAGQSKPSEENANV